MAEQRRAEIGPLDWSHKFAGGLFADVRRRRELYLSDWKDAFSGDNLVKTSSSTLFLFFACLSPAIAFGLLFEEGTRGAFGIVEMILSSAIAGVAWAIFSGQPLCILGATGPVLAYTVVVYNMVDAMDLPFLPMYFWTGIWFSVFTILMAVCDVCCVISAVTEFTEEIFSVLISAIFIVEAIKPTIKNFHDDKTPRDAAFLQLFLMLGTYVVATKLAALKNTNSLSFLVRKVLSSFGVTISIFIFTTLMIVPWWSDCDIQYLHVPSTVRPTWSADDGKPRAWTLEPFGSDDNPLPVWGVFFAVVPAAGFAVLGFLDQNLTTLLVNRKANGLKKPPAYHLDMLVCGAIVYPVCAVFGLPFPVAATVRSLTHLISLTNYEIVEVEGGGQRKKPVNVVEQRATNLGIHVLIGLSLVFAPVLKYVPKAVLLGVFLFMGVSSLTGNQMWERIQLWFIWETSKFPKYDYVQKVKPARIHLFTFLQVACFGILYFLKSTKEVAVIFPFFIASLVFIRRAFTKIFTADELQALDGHEDEAEVAPAKPGPPAEGAQDVEAPGAQQADLQEARELSSLANASNGSGKDLAVLDQSTVDRQGLVAEQV